MKKITLTPEGFFQHIWLPGVHTIPAEAIAVNDDDFMLLSQNPTSKKYDTVTETVVDYVPPFVLSNAQQDAMLRIVRARNTAIVQPVTSSALGSAHTYSVKPENRQFLNDLITLGNGGKFTSTNINGVKARRLHTHAELLVLAGDIETQISAQFDHYELKIAEVMALTETATQADFDAIVW